jgi:molybdopterin-containing oxidoreductase family molybdopterin binding subunit
MSEEKFVYTACPGWGDHDYCAIKTIVKDGKIVRTEKPCYTGADFAEGHICQKGLTAGRQPYNPNRLLYPLKRKEGTPRGGGEWERISWDQALDEIAAKLLDIREKYGPQSVVVWNLAASTPPNVGILTQLPHRFISLWGATDPLLSQALDNGPLYTQFYNFGPSGLVYFMIDPRNFDSSDYILVWGADPIANQMRVAKHLVEAKMNGAKITDIGVIFDATAGWCDDFVGVAPGSDGYLALAMANHIVKTNQYDEAFLTTNTTATYLIRCDDGMYYHDANGDFAVWDEAAGAAVPVAPAHGEIKATKPALLGQYRVGDVDCKPAFQLLVESLEEFAPEQAEKIVHIPASEVTRLADEYAAAKNAYIIGALGLRYVNQGETYRSFYILGFLTGNVGHPGAGVTAELLPSGYPISLNTSCIARPLGREGNKAHCVRMPDFFEEVKAADQPYHAFIKTAGNPVHNNPTRARWENLFDKMDLVVDIDVWMTDTSELADYVLPDCMPFERYDIINMPTYNHVVLQEPAIEPQGEARDAAYLWRELGKRLGMGEWFDKSMEEWIEMTLDTDYPLIANIDPPVTLERLKKEKVIRSLAPADPPFDPTAGMVFATKSGRIEFYNEQLKHLGFELPRYIPPIESPVIDNNNKEYPYQLFTGRQRFFMQSMFTDDPINVELSGGEPATRINPADAEREGLKDGDKVEVYNQRGHVVTKLCLDEAVPSGTIHVWFGWRRRHFEDGMYNEMLIPLGDISTIDAVANQWWNDLVDSLGGYADTGTNFELILSGAWDHMWDCACAIRKAE